MKKILLFTLFLFVTTACFADPRIVTKLDTGWKFSKDANEQAFEQEFDDSGWQDVTVPHDWAIAGPVMVDGDGKTGKLPWKGEGWYRKKLNIPQDYAGKRLYLLCDGMMAFPVIYVNGQMAGKWDYGYNSFYIDITDYVECGQENTLAIHVDTRPHDSRWYPGAGIYRKIQLIAVNPVHVDIWGTYVTTPIIKPNYADVKISTIIKNRSENDVPVEVQHVILDADSNEIVSGSTKGNIAVESSGLLETTLTLPNPVRWDLDNPYLYTVVTMVTRGKELLDRYTSVFGVRTMRFTADNGFYLNDKRVQFRGVNLHHDQGPLGAAFNVRAMQRQLEIMKKMGCNAVRTSHNVPAPELLDLCDRMGMLVFDEVFDKYDAKADIVDSTDFEDFAHRNIRNFVVRDRNHPCIFIWSVGNEIHDVQADQDNGFHRLHTMVNYVKKYDISRPVTMACDIAADARKRHFDYYDIHSWNYGRRWALARQLEPNKAVIISESASTVSTRGFYEFPLPKVKTAFTNSLQVSSYDLNAPEWADVADDDFMWQQQEPYIAGEFVWTGFDYIGEPTPYNGGGTRGHGLTNKDASKSSYFGIVDLCGIPKDRYYLYKSYWLPNETTVHILPHWNWPDRVGNNVPVFVYTNGDYAELFLNGKSLGVQYKNPKSDVSIERFRLMWNDVVYEPGELKAVAYKAGRVIGESIVKTTGAPARLRLSPDRVTIKADGKDLSYILIEAIDKDGNVCPLANNTVKITVTGKGGIAGVGNGNPQCMSEFQADTIDLFYGKAMLIVQSRPGTGKIDVKVGASGLHDAKTVIETK